METAKGIQHAVREAATSALWRQWRALGASALGGDTRPATSLIDPEALVLGSLAFEPHERRLGDFLAWWAAAGARFLSVQRAMNLAGRFPPALQPAVSGFAAQAVQAGDRRWRRLAEGAAPSASSPSRRAAKGAPQPVFDGTVALVFKLRASFGVSVKADILPFLLPRTDEPEATARTVAEALGYSEVAVRDALEDMVLGGAVYARRERPVRYGEAGGGRWIETMHLQRPDRSAHEAAPWRYWDQAYAFLADADAWASEVLARGVTGYPTAVSVRAMLERHRAVLYRSGSRIDQVHTPGEAFLQDARAEVERVARWLEEHV